MTACTNNGGSRARRAVTAALVGVLSVGAAPMVALATTGTGDVSLQAVDPGKDWLGEVTYENGKGEGYTLPEKDTPSFSSTSGEYLLPTAIDINGETVVFNYAQAGGDSTVVYYAGSSASGSVVAQKGVGLVDTLSDHVWEAGTYTVQVTYNGTAVKTAQFKITDVDLANATLFNATDGNKDASVTDFTYNGGTQKIGMVVDGVVLSDDQYDLGVWKDGKTWLNDDGEVTDAGTYTIYVFKNGHTAADSAIKTVELTVNKLDLSDATLTIEDVQINGTPKVMAGDVEITSADADIAYANTGTHGLRTATVTGKDANVTGKATANFNVVNTLVTTFKYRGNVKADGDQIKVNLANGAKFDESKIEAVGANEKDWDVTYAKEDGSVASASDLSTPGTYYATVRVNAQRTDYALGGSVTWKVLVIAGPAVTTNDVAFLYKGEIKGTFLGVTYSGEDFLKDITTIVKSGDKTLTPGEDYTVVVKDTATDEVVDSIVDAGTYEITLESDAYEIKGADTFNKFTVTVGQLDLKYVYAKSDLMQTFGSQTLIPYTGEDIDADFTYGYYVKDGVVVKEGTEDAAWVELPEGTVKVDAIRYDEDGSVSSSDALADSIKEKGNYRIYFSLAKGVKNFKTTRTYVENEITVSDKKVFTDVPNDAWYAEAVYAANDAGYIGGIGGSTLFAPLSNITRADVACVLYRMAGGSIDASEEGMTNSELGYISQFEDVDPNAYYAKAVAWTTKVGITNGYGTTFGSDRAITTEEFATMLARYAKVTGTDTSVDADAVLAKVADGDKVTGYARESVAWAVEQGILAKDGNLIDPQGTIYRARVVQIAVDFQPTKLDDVIIAPNPGLDAGAEDGETA